MRSRLLLAAPVLAALLLATGCTATPEPEPTSSAAACSYNESGSAARAVDAPPADPTVSGTVTATLETNAGTITMALDADETPCTVNSFASLAEQGYFDDTECHRITTSGIFILQCGDPTATGTGGPGYRFDDELTGSETYPAGTVAMANAGADTNGSQFFFVYEDTQLAPSYTVIGTVNEASLTVLREIAAKGQEGADANGGAPAEPVEITSVTIS